jgi:hypothetical protein
VDAGNPDRMREVRVDARGPSGMQGVRVDNGVCTGVRRTWTKESETGAEYMRTSLVSFPRVEFTRGTRVLKLDNKLLIYIVHSKYIKDPARFRSML